MNLTDTVCDPSRLITRCLKWMLIGAVASLLVAWGNAYIMPYQPSVYQLDDPKLDPTLRAAIQKYFYGGNDACMTSGLTGGFERLRYDRGLVEQWYGDMFGGTATIQAEDYGWPIAAWSVWHEMDCDTPARVIAGVELHKPRPVSPEVSFVPTPDWALPIVPRLHLVAASAAIYGGAAWLVVVGTRRTVAHTRACRGRCGRCNYDLGATLGRCPECGVQHFAAPIPPSEHNDAHQ